MTTTELTNSKPNDLKKVVIIGGGFGGISAAKSLVKCRKIHITLINRTNHHTFQPLLYQVATAGLSPAQVAVPIRSLFNRKKNIDIVMGDVEEIKKNSRQVIVSTLEHPIEYDYLVVATGATHSYFGQTKWEELSPGLKTIEDALEIRRRVLYQFEAAEMAAREGRPFNLCFVIIGGGPTGTELAGAISELARFTVVKDYRFIKPSSAKIYLIEGGPRVLGMYHPTLSERAKKDLEKMGVTVKVGQAVTDISEHYVKVGDEIIETSCVIWAAGVRASPIGQQLSQDLDRAGRVKVNPTLQLPDDPRIFVIGDLAHLPWKNNMPVPGVAPAAMQMGRHAAANIKRLVLGETPEPFIYFDKGSLATIGRHSAVGQIGSIKIKGWLAWCGWLAVHLLYLVGFKNRIFVLIDWVISYLFYRRGARLITAYTPPRLTKSSEKRDEEEIKKAS